MIDSKSEYRFVTENALANVTIAGRPYPARDQKLIVSGEDEAFLEEAVRERAAMAEIGHGEKLDRRIRVVRTRFADGFCARISSLIAQLVWADPEKIEDAEAPGSTPVLDMNGEYDYDAYNQARERSAELRLALEGRIYGRNEEAAGDVRLIEGELADLITSEDAALADSLARLLAAHEASVAEITTRMDADLERIRARWDAEIADLRRRYDAEEDIGRKMGILVEIEKAEENEAGEVESAESAKEKELLEEDAEYRASVADAGKTRDEHVSDAREKAEKDKKDVLDACEEANRDDRDATYAEIQTVVTQGVYTAYDGKTPSIIAFEDSLEDAIIRESLAAGFYRRFAKFSQASTPLKMVFDDINRMIVTMRSVAWRRVAATFERNYTRTSDYPERTVSETTHYFVDEWGSRYENSYSRPEEMDYRASSHTETWNETETAVVTPDSNEICLYLGTRETADLIDHVCIFAVLRRDETSVSTDDGYNRSESNNRQDYIVRIRLDRDEDAGNEMIRKVDALDDEHAEDVRDEDDAYQETIDGIEADYAAEEKAANDERDAAYKAAEDKYGNAIDDATEAFVRSAYSGAAAVNALIDRNYDSNDRRALAEEYDRTTIQPARTTMNEARAAAFDEMSAEKSAADSARSGRIYAANETRTERIRAARRAHEEALDELNEAYQSERNDLLGIQQDKVDAARESQQAAYASARSAHSVEYSRIERWAAEELEKAERITDPDERAARIAEINAKVFEDKGAADAAYRAAVYNADKAAYDIISKIDACTVDARARFVGTLTVQGSYIYQLQPGGRNSLLNQTFKFSQGEYRAVIFWKPRAVTDDSDE